MFETNPARDVGKRKVAAEKPIVEVHLPIEGIDCAASAQALERELKKAVGVYRVSVNPTTAVAHIAFDPDQTGVAEFVKTIRENGHRIGFSTAVIPIFGMHCASCVTMIEDALIKTAGVFSASVNLGTRSAHVTYLPEKVDVEGLRHAVESAGYQVQSPVGADLDAATEEERDRAREYQTLMRKFWFAAAMSIPVVVLSYPDLIPGLREWLPMGSPGRRILWGLLGLLTLPVMLWSGSQFFTGMWQVLKHRSANMHTLIAIGVSAAYLYSVAAVAFPNLFPRPELAEVFWDVTAVVVTLVVLGLALELKARRRTSEAIRKLIGLQAKTARVIRGRQGDRSPCGGGGGRGCGRRPARGEDPCGWRGRCGEQCRGRVDDHWGVDPRAEAGGR